MPAHGKRQYAIVIWIGPPPPSCSIHSRRATRAHTNQDNSTLRRSIQHKQTNDDIAGALLIGETFQLVICTCQVRRWLAEMVWRVSVSTEYEILYSNQIHSPHAQTVD